MRKSLVCLVSWLVLSFGAASATEIGDDGLHKQTWFTSTFRDIGEDIETARDEGKRLVMIFEQRGCIYCAQLHEKVFSDPEVAAYIQEHFMVVQYNMFGDEEVIDLNGDELSEKTAAREWRVVFTPTIMFMPEEAPNDVSAAKAAVSTMPGAFGRWTSLHMFQWVVEKGYESDEHFQKYHARKIEEARAAGLMDE
ncbi:MAG: thioredoxin family protein [Hyphomicrobiales bacterium]